MRVLISREDGLLELETTLASKPVEFVQDTPEADPNGPAPDGFVPGEIAVQRWIEGCGIFNPAEAQEVYRRCRAWFGMFRNGASQQDTRTARVVLLPVSEASS